MSAGLELGKKSRMSRGKDKGILESIMANSTLPLPTSNVNDVADLQGEAGSLLQPSHVRTWPPPQRSGRRRSAGAAAPEAQLLPLGTMGASPSAPTGGASLGAPHGPLGVMSIASLLPFKSHTNSFVVKPNPEPKGDGNSGKSAPAQLKEKLLHRVISCQRICR